MNMRSVSCTRARARPKMKPSLLRSSTRASAKMLNASTATEKGTTRASAGQRVVERREKGQRSLENVKIVRISPRTKPRTSAPETARTL
jgi:hypothetical protein